MLLPIASSSGSSSGRNQMPTAPLSEPIAPSSQDANSFCRMLVAIADQLSSSFVSRLDLRLFSSRTHQCFSSRTLRAFHAVFPTILPYRNTHSRCRLLDLLLSCSFASYLAHDHDLIVDLFFTRHPHCWSVLQCSLYSLVVCLLLAFDRWTLV